MVNTKSLQQVLDEIDKMLAAGSISAEEAETMKLEAKAAVAEEEEVDVAEETENEDEFRDTDDVKFKETFGEDVPEVEETEEVVEETEGEDDIEEEEVEEEEVEEEPRLNDRQLNQLEKLLKKGSKEDGTFDINNLNPRQKKRYEELISIQESDPDDVAVDTSIGGKIIRYNNGSEEEADEVLENINNLGELNLPEGQKYLPGYIEREDGERLAVYEYGDNGEIIGQVCRELTIPPDHS